MDFNIESDRSTDADVGWYANYLAYSAGEISWSTLLHNGFCPIFF